VSDLSGNRITRASVNDPWRYRFRIRGEPYGEVCKRPDGTPIFDKAEAEKFAAAKYEEIKNGAKLKQAVAAGFGPWRFERACAFWLAKNDVELVGLSLQTPGLLPGKKWALEMLDKYDFEAGGYLREKGLAEQVRWLCKTVGPNTYLHEFKKDDIKNVRDRRVATKKQNGARVAAKTVNKTLNLLRRVLHYAEIEGNAMVAHFKLSSFFLKVDTKPVPKDIPQSMEARIYATVRQDYVPIVEFARTSGLRSSENILRWTQVLPLEDGEARSVEVKSRGEVRKVRDVMLGEKELEILREEYARPDRHGEFVFTFVAKRTNFNKRAGRKYVKGHRYPITEEGFKTEWQRMQQRADGTLAGVNRHRLRHAAGWEVGRQSNGNPFAVQKALGHASITTSQLYTGVDDQKVRDAKSQSPRASALVAAEKRKAVAAKKTASVAERTKRTPATVARKVARSVAQSHKTLQNKG
jgi:site-specific recombinase XerD